MSEIPRLPDHDDYRRALEVIAGVTHSAIDEFVLEVIDEAEIITFANAALRKSTYPEYRPFMKTGLMWLPKRPKRPNDMSATDLVPGTRILLYNDEIKDKLNLVKEEVILSHPFYDETADGRQYLAVEARRVESHKTDFLALDSELRRRAVPLFMWGITPNLVGLYSSTKYIVPYT